MTIPMSTSKKLNNATKSRIASIVLYVLYAGVCELYKSDSRVRKEINSWPDGMTYCLKCSAKGPAMFFRKNGEKLQRLNNHIQKSYDTCITFKSLEQAFIVLTGRRSIAGAYAAHAFSLHGDVGTAMELMRCVDIVESYLFPKVMTKRILLEVAKKKSSTVGLYTRVGIGALRGAYGISRDEKRPFRVKARHRKYEEAEKSNDTKIL